MNELISIIIPVYNTQKYLNKCLTSILMQTYSNLQILLVDDGSTDDSLLICQKYAEQDKRIKLIHIQNQGRVYARKLGMTYAEGEIITFADSDDWLEPDAIEKMYKRMIDNNVDIVIAGCYISSDNFERKALNKMMPGIYEEDKLEVLYQRMLCDSDFFDMGIQPYLCNKLFRRSVIEKYIFDLDEKIVVGEDVLCVYPAMLEAKSICIVDETYYHYYMHNTSTMKTFQEETEEVENIRRQYWGLRKLFGFDKRKDELLTQMKRYILHHFLVRALNYVNKKMDCETVLPFENIKKGSKILLYGAGALGIAAYNFFGQRSEYQICAWCDRAYIILRDQGYPICSLEEGLMEKYDYILITILNEKAVRLVEKELISRGIEKKKIKWLSVDKLTEEGLLTELIYGN